MTGFPEPLSVSKLSGEGLEIQHATVAQGGEVRGHSGEGSKEVRGHSGEWWGPAAAGSSQACLGLEPGLLTSPSFC